MKAPRDPSSQFPPVRLQSDLAPVDAPQFLPGVPHNLPANRDRPPRRGYAGSGAELLGIVPANLPSTGPAEADESAQIFDPHHYANVIEGNFTPTVNSLKFLDAPAGKRNWLLLRNGSTTASVRIGMGNIASASSPLVLVPGAIILLDVVVPQNDLYCQLSAVDATAALLFSYSTIAG